MKIKNYILSLAAAVGLLASCQEAELVKLPAPDKIVAPELTSISVGENATDNIEITAENLALSKVTFNWSKADFGVSTQVDYAVELALQGGSDKKTLISGITEQTATQTFEALNALLLYDLEIEAGVPTQIDVYVSAQMGAYQKYYSQPKTITITVTKAEKVYPTVWVIGDYCGWNHGNSQFLFDFIGEDKVYQGVVDFGEKAANGFKLTGVGSWDDSCNWGIDGNATAPEAEAGSITLISSGGSGNIMAYSKRFYHFAFDKSSLVLTKNLSFNTVGIIGSATPNGWDSDTDMKFDKSKQKFYVDVTLTDGEIKFRADDGWDLNWGGTIPMTQGGDNIPVTAGNYRVYLNLNDPANISYELNSADYGSAEPAPDEPDQPDDPDQPAPANEGWGIVGTINNWGNDGDADVDMKLGTGWLVATNVEIPEGGEVKFRLDGDWAVNLGGTFVAGEAMALTPGGDNIKPAAGTYDIYLNPHIATAYFMTAGASAPAAPEVWGVVGTINNWGGDDLDIAMTNDGTYWVAKGVVLADGDEIKVRWASAWNIDFGGTFEANVQVPATKGGSNFKAVAGTYDIYLDEANSFIYFMTDGKTPADAGGATPPPAFDPDQATWGIVGDLTGWGSSADIAMTKVGEWLVAKGVTLKATDGFKIRANGEWNDVANFGLEGGSGTVDLETETKVITSGGSGNMSVQIDGTYDIYFSYARSVIWIMKEGNVPGFIPETAIWGIVGDPTNWANGADIIMTQVGEWLVAKEVEFTKGQGFKIRANGEWNDVANYGLESGNGDITIGVETPVITSGGSGNMVVQADGKFDIYFSYTKSVVWVLPVGDTPEFSYSTATWGIVGDLTNWAEGADIAMTKDGEWLVAKGVTFAANQGFKIRANGKWNDAANYGLEGGNGNITIGVETAVISSGGSGNMVVTTAGKYDIYFSYIKRVVWVMAEGKTPTTGEGSAE